LHQSKDRVDLSKIKDRDLSKIETFLTPSTIINKSLSLQGQLHPCVDAEAWLPAKMVQGTVQMVH
jgi:hypothetical protein